MNTWHIHIRGKVQGVGFRPYVFQKALNFGLKGWVSNMVDGVHLEFNATEVNARNFLHELVSQAPVLAQITDHSIYSVELEQFNSFNIVHHPSEKGAVANLLLTPDSGICMDCKQELWDKKNYRYKYPFITCTNCGPRYSIIQSLPYDRPKTTMEAFSMCNSCTNDYNNPHDRRYYSQTNSCPECAIQLSLYQPGNKLVNELSQDEILDHIPRLWRQGKIIAIKGIGGYILTCDANNKATILELRKRKQRPTKPFAVMFPNLSTLNQVVECDTLEAQSIQYPISPIVLLALKEPINESIQTQAIAPGLNHIGSMLPYMPLYDLLLREFGKPIIATSGNISHSPIVFQDEKALHELSDIADYILANNRQITVPQDDSVIKLTTFSKAKIIIRRSRGLAPTIFNADLTWPKKSVLALGAMLKSTFAILHAGNTYVSQYLGNLDHYDSQENFRHTFRHLSKLLGLKSEVILTDPHPEYPSTQFGEELARSLMLPIMKVQHHIAHFSAILGENNLINDQEAILGVIWDGTGLGDDGNMWGGEFFKYKNYDFLRCYHFDYFDFILGDKMPKEPRISALSGCWDVWGMEDLLKSKFTSTEWKIYSQILNKRNSLQTSSVGRIFDAVASLLGIMDTQSFEGEAAMRLEGIAWKYFKQNGLKFSDSYFIEGAHYYRIPTKSLITKVIMDLKKGKPKDFIAAKFHFSLVKLIEIVANNLKIRKLAFSGGVFQNGLLVDLINHHLKDEFDLYFHKELSPNDENISFGQLVYYSIQQHKEKITKTQVEEDTEAKFSAINY